MSNVEDILYLNLGDVLLLYATRFECSFEDAVDQLRNRDGLESALARPQQHAHYNQADMALQVAVLIHSIAEGQPFVEGNKRTAGDACTMFLNQNGYTLMAPQEDVAAWILALSTGLTEEELAANIRPWLVR